MKRTKVLALVLVAAVMMMGAGYAYWTQDLTIENTVTTGELEVVFTAPSVTVDDYMDLNGTSTLVPATLDGPHALTMNLYDAYPGAEIGVVFSLMNDGTMAANVRDFDITNSVNSDLVLCTSYKIGSSAIVTMAAGSTLAETLEAIDDIDLDKGVTKAVTMNLQIDPDADENLAENDADAISFTINAIAHQYND